MKYTRFEDKIIPIQDNNILKTDDGHLFYINDKPPLKYIVKSKYINLDDNLNITIKDTIEELCDVFVVYRQSDGKEIYDGTRNLYKYVANKTAYEYAIEEYNGYRDNEKEIWLKGAIWTEWGLKYVAKINSEGELELI